MTESRPILLVEDNEDNRIVYSTILRHGGFEVLEARTGTEGVALTRQHRPSLVLMDISLPELDGWAATRMLKRDPETAHIPIIALTAHARPDDRRRSEEAGCDGHLAKPIEPLLVLEEVRRWLARGTPELPRPVRGEGLRMGNGE